MLAQRRFLFAFCVPVVFFLVLVLGLTVWQQKVTGDLARIGRWSERDFGTHLENDDFLIRANSASAGEPDVLVLGDSFSLPNIWQTVVSNATGQRVLSWQMNDRTCIRAWAEQVLSAHPQARTVIVESVERGLVTRGANKFGCADDGSTLADTPPHRAFPARSYWPLTMNLEYLGRTLLHTVQQDLRDNGEVRNETVNVPLRRRDLFSNRRSDRLLYYTDDEPAWHAKEFDVQSTVRNFADLDKELKARGVRLIVLVVPDKSHVYRSVMKVSKLPVDKPEIPAMLVAQGLECPVLLPRFTEYAVTIVDFYLPDDTHLSERGFRILGDEMARVWFSRGQIDAGRIR